MAVRTPKPRSSQGASSAKTTARAKSATRATPPAKAAAPRPAKRVGATRIADVEPAVLQQLEAGDGESATLAELLAIDFTKLIGRIVPEIADDFRVRVSPDDKITRKMLLVGELLHARHGMRKYPALLKHASDVARGWGAYVLAHDPKLTLAERIEKVRPLADDPHAGVREWAWLALRGHIAEDIRGAITLLTPWTTEASANLRRFAVESTRPRGVWSAHIALLKRSPELALPLLDPLKADSSKYVQDSVANWLNDAAKSKPDWVRAVVTRWKRESKGPATRRIAERAQRSIS